ncbi:uncharacterized protein LOC110012152 [Sesamum indicum]|uniref:Uncharacterized protein LOC110012152 n=1 Tax=Sesamum indicum TaxID=4182 RepID=A0A8M8V244_SESIN|nr:uncharacterized protein LOC110012152 [Sesamum indicum]
MGESFVYCLRRKKVPSLPSNEGSPRAQEAQHHAAVRRCVVASSGERLPAKEAELRKVLELPFHSDADVSIDETSDSFRFTAATDDISGGVRADAVEIYPGVTKIVIRGNGVVDLSGTEFELDLWRFRLPASTLPELASASYEDGELVVTVPKGAAAEEDDDDGAEEDGDGDMGAGSRLVLVQ